MKTTRRICSCCGQGYTDGKGHDLDTCIETCRARLDRAEQEHANARDALERASQRKLAHLKEQLRKSKEAKAK